MEPEPPSYRNGIFSRYILNILFIAVFLVVSNKSMGAEGGNYLPLPGILLLSVLLLLSALFSGAEAAYFSISSTQKERLLENGDPRSKLLFSLLADRRKLLATLLGGNEIMNNLIALTVAGIVHYSFPSLTIWEKLFASTIVALSLLLVFGEVIPKSIALRNPLDFAFFSARFIKTIYFLLSPVRFVILLLTEIPYRWGRKRAKPASIIREKDFLALVKESRKAGELDENESALIENIFEFSDLLVKDVMTPAKKMVSISKSLTYDQLLKFIKERPFSRFPVYDGAPGVFDGLLHTKDLIPYIGKGFDERNQWREAIKPLYFVEADDKAHKVLKEFRFKKVHIALVKERGEVVGLVTLEDLLEEVFGEIRDEKESLFAKKR